MDGVDHTSRPSGVVGPEQGTLASGQRGPGSVSFRPAERAWRAFFGRPIVVSRELAESKAIVSSENSKAYWLKSSRLLQRWV